MKIKILPPVGISYRGPRERNEDAIYPAPGTGNADNRLFIVCDGVGGSDKGEVASQLACDMFVQYFGDNPAQEVDAVYLSKALEYAEASFDGYFRAKPHAKGMATTIALVCFHDKGAEVAWCGDTRVYQIRGDQIIFRTEDHSFVNELIQSGTITEEQAKNHPNRNVITRAIQGASQKRTALDVRRISDLQAGDYFFICTDGVWEPVNDMMLTGVLSGNYENNYKIDFIEHECKNNSNDNYSCYLIQVERVEEMPAAESNIQEDNIVSQNKAERPGSGQRAIFPGRLKAIFKKRKSISNATLAWVLGLIGVIVLIVLIDSRQNRRQESVQGPVQDELIATDDQAWQRARVANTIASYDAYLNEYPNGRYASQARNEKNRLVNQERDRQADEQRRREEETRRQSDPFANQMVLVRGGTFTMGCSSEQGSDCVDSEKPAHQITLGNYYIGKYEVTQGQWRQVMGKNPSHFSGCDDCPVESVSWNDVQGFIRKLNEQTGKRYRLPTEAEWEFAARGGNNSRGYKYAGGNNINEVAWHDGNSSNRTRPVGGKNANELGIHDMSGNVWELCDDWYGLYKQGSKTNPQGPSSGTYRVVRGGSWYFDALSCRLSNRSESTPDKRGSSYGFRLAMSP